MYDMDGFGALVAAERKKKGMTQDELAARLSITPQAVSKWENGIGYPDVTLFPKLAEALGLPVERLFGKTEASPPAVSPAFPHSFDGLALIGSEGYTVCYSDKTPDRSDGTLITFTDGSTADLSTKTAVNVGPGEIRIFEAESTMTYGIDEGITSYDESFGDFRELAVSTGFPCEVRVESGSAGRVTATGGAVFISLIEAAEENGRLTVKVKSQNNYMSPVNSCKLMICVPFTTGDCLDASLNATGSIKVMPDFKTQKLRINGSGSISVSNAGASDAAINGSGAIAIKEAGRASLGINGSGTIECRKAVDTTLKINGSGCVAIRRVSGSLELKINGSGSISCAGETDTLKVGISGSGDLSAEKLTVGDSDIRCSGACDVTIGRIKGRSVEKLGRNGKLRVLRRG